MRARDIDYALFINYVCTQTDEQKCNKAQKYINRYNTELQTTQLDLKITTVAAIPIVLTFLITMNATTVTSTINKITVIATAVSVIVTLISCAVLEIQKIHYLKEAKKYYTSEVQRLMEVMEKYEFIHTEK